MWEKLKKYLDTVGFISAVVFLLGGLIILVDMLIVNPQSVEWHDIPFFLIYPVWIIYSLNKKNYFSRK